MKLTGEKSDQGCLASAVRPDDPNAVATLDEQRTLVDDLSLTKSHAHILKFGDEATGHVAGGLPRPGTHLR